jgi:hypothetical protein
MEFGCAGIIVEKSHNARAKPLFLLIKIPLLMLNTGKAIAGSVDGGFYGWERE